MTNPFDNVDGKFVALKNIEGQYSLWPDYVTVPDGWEVVQGPDTKAACLAFIDQHWNDLRPLSLINAAEKQH